MQSTFTEPDRHPGKGTLETDYVLFRGPERIKIGFGELTSVKAESGVLSLDFPGGPVELELGAAAEKWALKILHPPLLMDKLGVHSQLAVRLIGNFDADFEKQIAKRKAVILRKGRCNLLFVAAAGSRELSRISRLKTDLKPGGALWVVYPKVLRTSKMSGHSGRPRGGNERREGG